MSDRDLLEKAARAAGHTIEFTKDESGERCWFDDRFTCITWNPLEDDGDEARLEAALNLAVKWAPRGVMVGTAYEAFMNHLDKQAARRRAGVRAAAAIGEKK